MFHEDQFYQILLIWLGLSIGTISLFRIRHFEKDKKGL
jgi:hypothetical protein